MLEDYFVKPRTVDRIRSSWLCPEIERYVDWLSEHDYRPANVHGNVPVVFAFGELARARGACSVEDLPEHIEAFVRERVAERAALRRDGRTGPRLAKDTRGPVVQMLGVVLPGFNGTGRRHREAPFAAEVPGFFDYLASERGLRPASVTAYRYYLDHFEAYLGRVGAGVKDLAPVLLSAYVTERAGAGLAKMTVREGCGVLRVFLRYAYREGVLSRASRAPLTGRRPTGSRRCRARSPGARSSGP